MSKKTEEKKDDTPRCCQGCVVWERHKKDCFYYWENKKHCTMWASGFNEQQVF